MSAQAGTVAGEVLVELLQAMELFPPMHSAHEAIAVIEEEFLELRDEVFWGLKKAQRLPLARTGEPSDDPVYRHRQAMRTEAIQTAAMAIRFIVEVCDG